MLRSAYGLPADRAERLAIAGTPVQVAELLARYVAAGLEHLVLVSDMNPWSVTCGHVAEVRAQLHAG